MLPFSISILLLAAVQTVVADAPVHIDVTGGVFFLDVANRYQVFQKDSSCYFWSLTPEEALSVMTPQGTRAMEAEMTQAMHHGVHVAPLDITTIGHLASAILTKCQDLHSYTVTRPHGHHGGNLESV